MHITTKNILILLLFMKMELNLGKDSRGQAKENISGENCL